MFGAKLCTRLVGSSVCGVAIAFVLLALSGCAGRLAHREDLAISGELTLPPGTTTVRLDLDEGEVSFYTHAEPTIRFDGRVLKAADETAMLARLRDVDPKLRQVGFADGVLTLTCDGLPADVDPMVAKVAIRIRVMLPDHIAIEAKTGFGKLGVENRNAAVKLTTGHGDLHLSNVTGDAVLRGCVRETDRVGGRVIVNDHSGNLDIEGNLHVEGKGHMLQVFVKQLGDKQLRVINHAGAVQVHVPEKSEFDLLLRAREGQGVNAFGIPKSGDYGRLGVEMKGRVGNGGPEIHLESRRQGNVSLSKR